VQILATYEVCANHAQAYELRLMLLKSGFIAYQNFWDNLIKARIEMYQP